MGRYQYQTLQVPLTKGVQGGPSARGTAVGAGVKLLHKVSVALNGWAVSYRLNQEIEKMGDQIAKAMPDQGGVLLCAGIMEWARPDATGTRGQSFLSLHIAGAGPAPGPVLDKYIKTPKMVAGAPEGWRRKDAYIWVTNK